jgi:hypothetical protein
MPIVICRVWFRGRAIGQDAILLALLAFSAILVAIQLAFLLAFLAPVVAAVI